MHRPRILGLALVGVLAMTAVFAQGALAADGKLTSASGESFTLKGEDQEGATNAFTYPGEPAVECEVAEYHGEATGGGALASGAESATVAPTYKECEAGGLPVTVTMNGCDYGLHLGGPTGNPGEYRAFAALACPEGQHPVIHVYLNAKHTIPVCTINIEPQSGLEGATLTEEEGGHLALGGTVEGIEAHKEGACESGSTGEASLHLGVTLEGIEESSGEAVGLAISTE